MIMPCRSVPIATREKLKAELERLVKINVIEKVDEPTEWVSQIVVVQKPDGKVRLCIDPKELNKALMREHYSIPTLKDVLHDLEGSKIFSKADLSSGYWHVKLDEEASKLTTFQTSYGRYKWLRLPFGLSVSAEIFQKKLFESLAGLDGIICIADDVVIHGRNQTEHDVRMRAFLERCLQKGIRLNRDKLRTNLDSVTFMGHTVSKEGLKPDPNKVKAIQNYPIPKNTTELRGFIGIVNYLAKFITNCSAALQPLHNLLKKDVRWNWSSSQEIAFQSIKKKIAEITLLAFYDQNKELTLENDASEFGIGSVLKQNDKPIAYASRLLSDTERRYAQIEKEMLAIVFGLEKFHHYVFGRDVNIITDHKPLVSICQKNLSKAPKRLQSLLLRAQSYNFKLQYKQGKLLPIADALSRNPVTTEMQTCTVSNISDLPLRRGKFEEIRRATQEDKTLKKLIEVISAGWPAGKNEAPAEVKPYFDHRDELTEEDGVVMRGSRIVIPTSLRADIKRKIHAGHSGVNSCLRRARLYVYWPHMSAEIKQFVESCTTCAENPTKLPQLPLKMHDVPDRAWQKVGTDLFMLQGRNYLVTTDYFSKFFEIDYLNEVTSTDVIGKLKQHFARYGIPEIVYSDNGPQFASGHFKKFCREWNIRHETSSPGNSRANGAAEAAVKKAKRMMKRCFLAKEDQYMALLNLRNTPEEGLTYSPSQRLMGRRTRTILPSQDSLLLPEIIDYEEEKKLLEQRSKNIGKKFDHRNEPSQLRKEDKIRMQPIGLNTRNKPWKEATVKRQLSSRSYEVESKDGRTYRRDRQHLKLQKSPVTENKDIPVSDTDSDDDNFDYEQLPHQRSRYGRPLRKPERYGEI